MHTSGLAASILLIASPAVAASDNPPRIPAAADSAGTPAASLAATESAAGAAQSAPAGLTPEQQMQLLQEVQALRARVQSLEARSTQVQYSPEAPQHHKLLGDNKLELYGFVQLDAIQDFDRVNPDWEATLRPSRIATPEGEFGSNGQSIFSVRQSRLGVKSNGMVLGKPYEAKIEFDLFGTGKDAGQTTIRFRQVYASWGPILVGQTNSLFMDGDLFPNVIDYWGPPGMVFLRTPQIRYTFLDRNGWKAAIALEHATHDVDSGNIRLIDENLATNIRNDEKLPDLTAQVRYEGKWGHVQLSGILRKVGYDTIGTPDNDPKGSQTGWGVNLGTSLNVSLATFRLGVAHGRGIASYMNDGGMDLAPSVSVVTGPGSITIVPKAEAVKLLGVTAYVDLQWSKKLSSALGYSFTKVDNTNFQDPSAFHKGEYASGNLLWTPADRILTGIELLWGRLTDNDGNKGTDVRLQTSFKFNFSSKDIWD